MRSRFPKNFRHAALRVSAVCFRACMLACKLACVFACVASSLISCAPTAHRHRFTGTTMGCTIDITVDEDDAALARNAARSAQLELDRLDAMLSDWRKSSELTMLNSARALRVQASAQLREVLARSIEVAQATDGRFDATIGPLVALWRASRKSGVLPNADAVAAAKERVGSDKVAIDGTMVVRARDDIALDFGGIGKGFGAVKALEAMRRMGCSRALVAVAGDIAAGDAPRGEPGWIVVIAPESANAQAQTLRAVNQAVSTSGGAEQWVDIDGVRYAHIVDPRTGLGATRVAQVTVVGPLDCAVDAVATGLALCETDAQVAAIMAKFPTMRARVERDGIARWIASNGP